MDSEADALAIQDTLERTAALKVVDRHGGQHDGVGAVLGGALRKESRGRDGRRACGVVVDANSSDAKISSATIAMAHKLGLSVVGEGGGGGVPARFPGGQ